MQDADIHRLREAIGTLLSLECSLDGSMLSIAESSGAEPASCRTAWRSPPRAAGRDPGAGTGRRSPARGDGRPGVIFIDPDARQLDAAAALGPLRGAAHRRLRERVRRGARGRARPPRRASRHARSIGLRATGPRARLDNTAPIAAIREVEELTGFAMVARALFDGVERCVTDMLQLIRGARR